LVGLQPDIILAGGATVTAALQRETRTIPIVFTTQADPVALRIVARLDRPGGNITGFANLEASLGGKYLELLSEIAPGLKRAAIMFNPDAAIASTFMPSLEAAKARLGYGSRIDFLASPSLFPSDQLSFAGYTGRTIFRGGVTLQVWQWRTDGYPFGVEQGFESERVQFQALETVLDGPFPLSC
jgi:hypothetical protein